MSDSQCTSVSSSTGSGHPTTTQAERKDKILREIESVAFVVNLTSQGAPLQADPNDVQRVLAHLRDNCRFTHLTLFCDDDSTVDAPRLPPNGFQTRTYEPFIHLLNIIIRAANCCLTSPRYLEALRFYPHGAEMRDNLDSGTQTRKPLKPQILGLLHSRTLQQPSWNDVSVSVEVNARLVDAIKRLETYARNHLIFNRRRSFSIAMSFNHKDMSLRFLCFHRSGISISSQLHLREEDGFRSAVEHMVGLLSIKDEEAFGLDMTRENDVYRLNNANYRIMRTIHMHDSIYGHATVVYSLQRQTADFQVIPADLRSRELTCIGTNQLPEKIVYKLSYQCEGHPSEGSLLANFSGQFGVVDIVGYSICTSEELFGSTAHLFSDPCFLKLGARSPVVLSPKYRYLHCTAMGLEGLSLLDIFNPEVGNLGTQIPTPAELVGTILHSMIGHFNLFIGGVLHRDVSSGNILCLQTPIKRTLCPITLSSLGLDDVVDLGSCQGILIDGDHAIKWHDHVIARSSERLGTLPFMSQHLLFALLNDTSVPVLQIPVLHTPVDDLESFLWVLVWSVVHILKEAAKIKTDRHSKILRIVHYLSSQCIPDILVREIALQHDWPDMVFKDLLLEWLQITKKSQTEVNQLAKTLLKSSTTDAERNSKFDAIDKYCRGVYKEYIQAGYKHLQAIRELSDWEAVVDFNNKFDK